MAPVLRIPAARRTLVCVLAGACAVLTFFPEHYRAAVSMTPTDPGSLGLSGTLGQLGAGSSVFGSQAALEISLKVARSPYVRAKVVDSLKLDRALGVTPQQANRWIDRKVDVRTLRGGILQVEMDYRDAKFAQTIVRTYAEAVRAQLAEIARGQTSYKRNILETLLSTSSKRFFAAQTAYDNFRLLNGEGDPQGAIQQTALRINALQEQILSKQGEIAALKKFATDDNIQVRRSEAELGVLQQQLAAARSTANTGSTSLGGIVNRSITLEKLQRELDLARNLYQNYKRFLEGTTVEDLASTANVRILEPAYIDPDRQYNIIFAVLGALIVVLGLVIEFYHLRPPLEAVPSLSPAGGDAGASRR
ncbi:hypothetical protein [Sphingomonas pokkalii]|nr:hypothetical protein [Sphingomonas pokkalii]